MRIASSLVVITFLSACAPQIANRGNWVDEDAITLLTPGETKKTDVLLELGSPSSKSTFDPNIWYYIGQTTAKTAFFTPQVIGNQMLVLSFDKAGTLDALVRKGIADYKNITPIRKSTPTAGKKLSFIEQLIGNVGRFNNNKAKQAAE